MEGQPNIGGPGLYQLFPPGEAGFGTHAPLFPSPIDNGTPPTYPPFFQREEGPVDNPVMPPSLEAQLEEVIRKYMEEEESKMPQMEPSEFQRTSFLDVPPEQFESQMSQLFAGMMGGSFIPQEQQPLLPDMRMSMNMGASNIAPVTTPTTPTTTAGDSNRWCSWCFNFAPFTTIRENVYQCGACRAECVKCNRCQEGMGRHLMTAEGSDQQCARCAGLIPAWGVTPLLTTTSPCSWCFNISAHSLLKHKQPPQRSIYMCNACGMKGALCLMCGEAMAKAGVALSWGKAKDKDRIDGDDLFCLKCSRLVPSWDNPEANRRRLTHSGWCSWCFENTTHNLEERHLLTRDVYSCQNCGCRTLKCTLCEMGMTRGGRFWDDKFCANCGGEIAVVKLREQKRQQQTTTTAAPGGQTSEPQVETMASNWEFLKKRKDLLVYQHLNRTYDSIKDELYRNSSYKHMAVQYGMLRPFLLLVSMSPILRNQVANLLGWSTLTDKSFGDSHEESWSIISRSGMGLLSYANSIVQKLIPITNSNYYMMLRQTVVDVCKTSRHPQLSFFASIWACNTSADPLISGLEWELLAAVANIHISHMTPQQKAEYDRITSSDEGVKCAEMLKQQHALVDKSYDDEDAARYAAFIIHNARQVQGQSDGQQSPTMRAMSLRPVPRAVVGGGLFGFFSSMMDLILGSSHHRLLGPLALIIFQRLILIAGGMKIESFY
jgi:hypothetical protein